MGEEEVLSLLVTIASYGTRFVVCDILTWSFTGVNSLRPQS